MRELPFRGRQQASQQLGCYLAQFNLDLKERAIVLGLARGGVPVAEKWRPSCACRSTL